MMPRYKLRTLLILLAILPPLLWFGWTKYEGWRVAQERNRQAVVAFNQFRLRAQRPLILTTAQSPALVQAQMAAFQARLAERRAAREAEAEARRKALLQWALEDGDSSDDAPEVERLQRLGYLVAPASKAHSNTH